VAKHDHRQPLATATGGCHLRLNMTTSGPHFIQTFSPNYSFIGDEAFGLSEHMLRPYSGKYLDVAKKYLTIDYVALDVVLRVHMAYSPISGGYCTVL
jgi:hypothetical protein